MEGGLPPSHWGHPSSTSQIMALGRTRRAQTALYICTQGSYSDAHTPPHTLSQGGCGHIASTFIAPGGISQGLRAVHSQWAEGWRGDCGKECGCRLPRSRAVKRGRADCQRGPGRGVLRLSLTPTPAPFAHLTLAPTLGQRPQTSVPWCGYGGGDRGWT